MMSDGTLVFVLLYKNGEPSELLFNILIRFLYLGIFATDCPEGDELLSTYLLAP